MIVAACASAARRVSCSRAGKTSSSAKPRTARGAIATMGKLHQRRQSSGGAEIDRTSKCRAREVKL